MLYPICSKSNRTPYVRVCDSVHFLPKFSPNAITTVLKSIVGERFNQGIKMSISFFGLHVNQSTNGYIWGSVRHHDEDDKSPMIHLLT